MSKLAQGARIGYTLLAWLFVAGVLYQVYLAGLNVVAGRPGWRTHVELGHGLGLPLLAMLLLVYLGRMPRRVKWLTWLLFGVYVIQADVVIFMRSMAPGLSATHPVLALIDFALAWWLGIRAWTIIRTGEDDTAVISKPADSVADASGQIR